MRLNWIFASFNAQERRSLILNIAQALGMLNFAFGVPLVIGLENYGFYVACFALPATVSVLAQSSFISLSAIGRENVVGNYFALLLVGFALLLMVVYSIAMEGAASTYAVTIYAALLSRVFFEVILYSCAKEIYLEILLRVEIFVSLVSCLILFIAWRAGLKYVELPILLLLINALVVLMFVLLNVNLSQMRGFFLAWPNGNIGTLFSGFSLRLYEEGFVTSAPLIIASVASNELAGQFRLGLSFAKAMTKIMPYRYELVLYSFLDGTLDKRRILSRWIGVSLIYLLVVGLVLVFNYVNKIYPMSLGLSLMLLSGPVVAFLLIFMPVAIKLRPTLLWLVMVLLAFCALSALTGNMSVISVVFVVGQLLLSFVLVRVMFGFGSGI